ncbi:hypothetical protein [Streptomyces sp. NPDC088752]|uniref:hypothetical protein n=1 Tax=Streptomyces sp. NPDC088752 TaxID=3154963 RepID=UPI003447F10F
MADNLCPATLENLSCTRSQGHRPNWHYDRKADKYWDRNGLIRFTQPESADDVTEEMVEIVSEKVNGWYSEGRIDWQDVWERADGARLEDGSLLDLGTDLGSQALKRLKREALKRRAE